MMRKRQIQDLMTQDELISMAKDAGCPDVYTEWAKSDWTSIKGLILPMTLEQLEHCAKLVAAKEREKWSGVEAYLIAASEGSMSRNNSEALAGELLTAIRARGQA